MNKLLKSKKALSPVVAAIILIAVTVAVSVAVAYWMGSMAVSDMEVMELTITDIEFTVGDASTGRLVVHVSNAGTSDVTVHSIRINGKNINTWSVDNSNTVRAGTSETFTLNTAVNEAAKYSVILFTIDRTIVGSYTATA